MKCEKCGKQNWEFIITERWCFWHKDGETTKSPEMKIGRANVMGICKTFLGGGQFCTNHFQREMTAQEFHQFMRDYGFEKFAKKI